MGKVISGARALVRIGGKLIGIFTNVSYGVAFAAEPSYILGRFSANDIDYTAAEVINISASGWRVYGLPATGSAESGAPGMPRLQDLLTADYVSFEVYDRQNRDGKPIMKVERCRCVNADGSFTARQLSEMSLKFMGLKLDDELEVSNETDGAASF